MISLSLRRRKRGHIAGDQTSRVGAVDQVRLLLQGGAIVLGFLLGTALVIYLAVSVVFIVDRLCRMLTRARKTVSKTTTAREGVVPWPMTR
jgi:hypothetical protein